MLFAALYANAYEETPAAIIKLEIQNLVYHEVVVGCIEVRSEQQHHTRQLKLHGREFCGAAGQLSGLTQVNVRNSRGSAVLRACSLGGDVPVCPAGGNASTTLSDFENLQRAQDRIVLAAAKSRRLDRCTKSREIAVYHKGN